MDFSCADDQSLPLNFEESANPAHLVRLEDSSDVDVTEKNDIHTSPLRTRTMKEYDQLIADLKKENFSLKLRIYFLEERIQQKLGRLDSSEDIHKTNIELKVEVEALKRELTDKNGLLLAASNALETLDVQHKAAIGRTKSEHETDKLGLSQRIEELEKLLEIANKHSGRIDSDSDTQWARAFSFMDNMSDVERSDGAPESNSEGKSASFAEANLASLQRHCKELELVVDDLHKEIDKHKARNKRLESNLSSRNAEMAEQKKNFLKLKSTVKRFVEGAQQNADVIKDLNDELQKRSVEITELNVELQRKSDELKQANNASEFKGSKLRELDNLVAELQSQQTNRSNRVSNERSKRQRSLEGDQLKSKDASLFRGTCETQTSFFEEITKEKDNMIMELLAERKDSLVETEQAVKSLQNSLCEKEVALERLQKAYEEKEYELKTSHVNNSSTSTFFEKETTKLKNKVALQKGCINKIKECFDAMLREGNGDGHDASSHNNLANDLFKLIAMVKRLASLDVFSLWESELNRFLLSMSAKTEELASVEDDNSKLAKRLEDSTAESNRLRFLLSSTEATVRMLGSKLNHQRGLSISQGHGRSRSNSIVSSSNDDARTNQHCSTSAPVTPRTHTAPASRRPNPDEVDIDARVLEEEICRLRLIVECKDHQLECLREDFDLLRPRCSCNDVGVQTVPVAGRLDELRSENKDVPRKVLYASHKACTLLRRRLEELADFLEQLLQFDENGLLDLSVLTPQKMASIRGHLERSRELSSTLSQSLAVYGSTMDQEDQENDSVFLQERPSSTSCLENFEATCGECDNDETVTVAKLKNAQKSCNKSLFCEPIASSDNGTRRHLTDVDEDSLLLLLNPSSYQAQSSHLDDLLVCSMSSTFHESFLTSTNVNGTRGATGGGIVRDIASESDSWSEPDRGVSQQRIGLDGSLVGGGKTPINSPGRLATIAAAATASSTTSSESELVSELGVRLNPKAVHKWRSVLRELKAVKGQVVELEELNLSLRAELSLYQSVCNDSNVNSPAVLSTVRSPLKSRGSVSRQGRNKNNGDQASLSAVTALIRNSCGQQAAEQQLRLENHLFEISALRKKLEESIRAYDQLREQLEKKLMSLQSANHLDNEVAIRLNSQIESCMKQIEERDSALCSLHKEKGNLLLEIQQLSDDFKAEQKIAENLRVELAEKVVEMERLMVASSEHDREARCDRNKLQQSLSRAQKLLRNNVASVKSLREANGALQRDLDKAHGALQVEKGRMDELVSELSAKIKLTQELEREMKSLRTSAEEALLTARRNFDEQMRIKQIESESKSDEIASLIQHKSRLEADIVQMRAQLQAALALSQSLKAELSVLELSSSTNNNSQNAALEENITLLVSEIRSLRLQLERSVETNTALRAQLNDNVNMAMSQSSGGGGLRLDVGYVVDQDQYASSVSSPDTASSFSYAATIETAKSAPENNNIINNNNNSSSSCSSDQPRITGIDRQMSKSSDYVSDDAGRRNHHRPTDVYSSPDLGIESDPNRCSSLERASSNPTLRGIHYLEPGMPSADSDWTSVVSAPATAFSRLCVSDSFYPKRNCTFPLLRTLPDKRDEDSNEQSEGFGGEASTPGGGLGNQEVYVIGYLEHFKLLQQNVVESVEILAQLKCKVKETMTTKIVNDDGVATWKEMLLGCTTLRKCLQESRTVLEQFWNVPLPLLACDGDSNENRRLETELLRLHRDLARERKRAEDALTKLEAANRIKESMEKAIVRQLNKTHCVLKKARGNLEIQQQKASSKSVPPPPTEK